jgi:hypothetical protein
MGDGMAPGSCSTAARVSATERIHACSQPGGRLIVTNADTLLFKNSLYG